MSIVSIVVKHYGVRDKERERICWVKKRAVESFVGGATCHVKQKACHSMKYISDVHAHIHEITIRIYFNCHYIFDWNGNKTSE